MKVGQRLMEAATESKEVEAANQLGPERKSNPLLAELESLFSQPECLVADLFARTRSSAAACLMVLGHQGLPGLKLIRSVSLYRNKAW